MQKPGKRFISCLAALALLLACAPAAFALADTVPDGFTPIYTPEGLDAIREGLDGKYILMNDIDMGAWGDWEPIGWSNCPAFTGTLDGNGYEIRNLQVDCSEMVGASGETIVAGLFGILSGNATVKNLGLVNASVCAKLLPHQNANVVAGGIAGGVGDGSVEMENVEIFNCYVQGAVAVQGDAVRGLAIAGGLVGLSDTAAGNITLRNCYTAVTITNGTDSDVFYGGGILGFGAIGATGAGLIQNCYSNIEPVGENASMETMLIANVSTLTMTQMRRQANFAGFDFTDEPVWYINEGLIFPRLRPCPLRVRAPIPAPAPEEFNTMAALGNLKAEARPISDSWYSLIGVWDTLPEEVRAAYFWEALFLHNCYAQDIADNITKQFNNAAIQDLFETMVPRYTLDFMLAYNDLLIEYGYTPLFLYPESPTFFPDPGTGVIAEADEGVFEPGTAMEVTELDGGNFVLGPGNSVHAVYDIQFVKGGQAVQPDGTVVVRLPITGVSPSASANWKVYYVERDAQGNITGKTDMHAEVKQYDGVWYWEFVTGHFSVYAVVEETRAANEPPPCHFWDNWPCWAQWILKYLLFGWLWMRWL